MTRMVTLLKSQNNDSVHRAATVDVPFENARLRGSVCNALLFAILGVLV